MMKIIDQTSNGIITLFILLSLVGYSESVIGKAGKTSLKEWESFKTE